MNSAVLSLGQSLVKFKERPSGVPLRLVLTYKGWPVRFFTMYATRRHDRFGHTYLAKRAVLKPKFWSLRADGLWVLSPDHVFRFALLNPLDKFTVRPGSKLTLMWKNNIILRIHY